MSLSDSPSVRLRKIQDFQLRLFTTPAAEPSRGAESFVLQSFEGNLPKKATLSESELTRMAEQILADAEEQRQYIEQQAYEEGFRQGQKDGQEVGRRGLEEITQRLEKMLISLMEEKEALYQRRERELVDLVLLISKKIVGRELTIQPEAIRDLVAEGFRRLADTEHLILRVHPQDYKLLAQHSRESWPPGLELIRDGTLTPGGFRMETERGELDGTLETRWSNITEAIAKVLEPRHED
jgi:flagellar assembly protein FliH